MARKQKNKGGLDAFVGQLRAGKIPTPQAPASEISFSFKYVDDANPKFGIQHCDDLAGYFLTLLPRLKSICQLSLNQFTIPSGNPKSLRSHEIKFDRTTEAGFPTRPDLWMQRPWQFEISANKYGRIHGFLLGTVFHVVWFDPKHALYSD